MFFKTLQNTLILLSFLIVGNTFAQIGLEEWRDHLPYKRTIAVAEGVNGRIYCATPNSAFYYDPTQESITRMNTITGLSDVSISTIAFNKNTSDLIIAYQNGNIDIINKDNIFNISDIKRKSMVGSKRINKIRFNSDKIYLACDFGIVVIDPVKKEIKDTYYIGPNGKSIGILDLDFSDSLFYAATSEGIYSANINEQNLNNFQFWNKDTNIFFPNRLYNCISVHSSGVYVNAPGDIYKTDSVYVLKNGNWSRFNDITHQPTYEIKTYGDTLLFVQDYNFKYFFNNMSESFLAYTYGDATPRPLDVIFNSEGEAWIADKYLSLVQSPQQWNYKFYEPEGPAYKNAYKITYSQGQLWVASGGIQSNWDNAFENKGVYVFKDQKWNSYNNSNTAVFDSVSDVMKVVVNPENDADVYIATWGKGIIRMNNGLVTKVYNNTNSTLSYASNYPGFIGVAGLAYDENNYLWVTNSANPNALQFMTPSGQWQSLSLSPYVIDNAVGDLVIDDIGQKWIVIPRNGGIVVYNDNNTPEYPGDDRKVKLSGADNNGKLPSVGVNALAKDKEGNIWVGTNEGVAVFYSPELVFSGSNFDAQQIYVEQEGISQYLLESEVVTSIAIDGANRKWFGTRNAGVFLMDRDPSKEVYHFTTTNSPLLSNNIFSIGIDDKSGEVFFGTENGIISFRSTATEGSEYQENNVKVFPNPVRPNYNGKIAINGLVTDANVKITDASGNLVYETTAFGGQAMWNGKNFDGERVATGVYFVFSTDEDTGEQSAIAKILFVK